MNARTRRPLLRMYPKSWRRRYGAEFDELLGATATTLFVVLDVACQAVIQRVRYAARALAALACFAGLDAVAVRAHVTDNILWAPTTPTRAVLLMITVAPLVMAVAFRKPCSTRRR